MKMGKTFCLTLALSLAASVMNAATDGTTSESNQLGYEIAPLNRASADSMTIRSNEEYDNRWTVGVHIGANYAMSENTRFGSFGDMVKPSVAVSVGKFFTPLLSARLQLGYLRQTSRVYSSYIDHDKTVYGDGNYNYSAFTGYVDGLLNLTRLFSKSKEQTRFNLSALLGIGLNESFGFDDDKIDGWKTGIEDARKSDPKGGHRLYNIGTGSHACLAMRAGLVGSYALSNSLDLNLETTLHAATDKLNGVKHNLFVDGYVNVMVGLAYHIDSQK